MDVDEVLGDFSYYEVAFDEPVDDLTERCSGFCGESELDMDDYFIKTSGFCTDNGAQFVDTMEECRRAFSSTGDIVNEVLRFKPMDYDGSGYCEPEGKGSTLSFSIISLIE